MLYGARGHIRTALACTVIGAAFGCQSTKDSTSPVDTTTTTTTTGLGDFAILASGNDDQALGAATDGTNILVPFNSGTFAIGSGIPGTQLISKTGLVGTAVTFGDNRLDVGSAAFDGTRYLTAYQQGVNDAGSDIWGQFITTAGARSGTAFQITTTGNAPIVFNLVYGSGGAYLLTYARGAFRPDVGDSVFMSFARRIDASGTVGPELTVGALGYANAAAFDGTNFLVIYSLGGTTQQMRGRFISLAGVLGADVPLSTAGISVSSQMSLAFNGTAYMAAWGDRVPTDSFPNDSSIFVQAISTSGTPLGSPTRLGTTTAKAQISNIIPLGSNFYVNWGEADANDLFTARGSMISPTGAVVSGPTTLFAPDTLTTSVFTAMLPVGPSKVLALVNRKIHGQWDVYAKFLTLQ